MKKLSIAGFALSSAVALSLHGCSGSNNNTPSAGGTGAFGIVTVNGKQLLFYPSKTLTPIQPDGGGGHGFVAVVDVGQTGNGMAGANALAATIDLGTPDQATTTAGNANVVVAAGTNTYNVWFINPSSNTVIKTIQLDPSLNGTSFSGGSGIVTGIAMDEANNRAILSVWDGFLFVDLGSYSVTGSVTSAASENFGFDSTHELVLNPFYNCGNLAIVGDGGTDSSFCNTYQALDGGGTITAGFNVVNLKTNKVYTYENPGAADPTQPMGLGADPDSAAVDPSTQIAAIPPEYLSQENFLDLSKAVYDDTSLTFTAPLIVVPMQEYDGVAVESKTHLAFFEEEFQSGIALIDMTQLNSDAGLPPSALIQATMPNTPVTDAGGGADWSNLGDPHGIAVTTGLQSNGPVGFVVTDDGVGNLWIARLDLSVMQALGPDAGGGVDNPQIDGGWLLSASAIAPAVTMLNGAIQE